MTKHGSYQKAGYNSHWQDTLAFFKQRSALVNAIYVNTVNLCQHNISVYGISSWSMSNQLHKVPYRRKPLPIAAIEVLHVNSGRVVHFAPAQLIAHGGLDLFLPFLVACLSGVAIQGRCRCACARCRCHHGQKHFAFK